ncbi:hypothetical protein HanXRQr2_Chr01g0004071 [Helianthus annuus]|uniref:Uncharacterized protein n=1 Tax=Helianthus annuus TaxID=4232 RepID=A0A9K3JSN1_HELAN|nr:hypothetical protein HanXRQr2_Chr01g0004071 [Helianthus annuus]
MNSIVNSRKGNCDRIWINKINFFLYMCSSIFVHIFLYCNCTSMYSSSITNVTPALLFTN